MTTLLLVEDDTSISEPLTRALSREGYTILTATTGQEALDALDECESGIEIMLLDLGLPDMDGLDVARNARNQGYDFPILILTARSEEVDMVVGLDVGADDYVTKPFRLAELLARVRALLRRWDRGSTNAPEILTIQDISLDIPARTVSKNGRELHLTNKEFDLLVALMSDAGNAISREKLLSTVWGEGNAESTKKLDMHISWLRRKLGEDVEKPRYIATVRGVGFRFEAE
ncbi:response regulator transcription factor [Actinotignum urinale]|uniref:Response regulator transcription factor n=1 Tax=Actinotignum urinale TaxID=190146 RepID=A0AAW9HVQ1_9ACTO|nr:response regulator transcription factor [Actinotignum urinale]MDY5132835.1 response regulator transcription factor [Actinotignum urinale]MDY5154159.1 response regulator transcription factor [Actinotignum urinale]MDY5159751.1 response regulator transcription factor [Actinotignum urinale]WIK58528.1 response regulator transcription factor [Actinotignum urinale]